MSNNVNLALSEKRSQIIVWTLLCLMPLIGMAVDLVAPSLPAIANDLQVSPHLAKNAISIYLLGYALGNLFTGFLTDAWGRRRLIRLSLLAFVIVSMLPIFFTSIEVLLLARILQGITLGSVAVIARSIFSDVLPAEKLIRLGTLIGTMWGLGPVVGPIIGGYLQFYFGWKAGFYFFAIVAAIGLIVIFNVIPETHLKRHALNVKTIKKNFMEVLTHRLFMAVVFLMGLMYSLIITFSTVGPFLVQTKLHYSPIFFGHLAFVLGIVFLASTFICRMLLKKYKVEHLFAVLINLFFLIAILALILSYFFANSIILFAVISAVMFFACGFIFPLSMGKGMSLFRHIAGTASASMYFINILITSATAFAVSFVHIQSAIPIMWTYVLLLLLCMLIYWGIIRRV